MSKYKTYATASAVLIDKPVLPLETKAIAAALEGKYGLNLGSQVDLLYVHSVLVSTGINANDDIFLPQELWDARKTPVLKPFNWQHESTDILGVMYGVAVRDFNGKSIDFDGEVPEGRFELHTEAAIYKLIQPARAVEITERSKAGNLFVSMEAWFDDYDFGLIEGQNVKIVKRTEATAWLDKHLKANGGNGNYNNYRVGRVLRSFTFGGCGFVDVPANKRSLIFEVLNLIPQTTSEDVVVSLLQEVEPIISLWDTKEKLMATEATDKDSLVRDAARAVLSEQAELAKAEAHKKEQEALVAKASQLESDNADLAGQVSDSKETLTAKDAEIAMLTETIKNQHASLGGIVSAIGEVPAEIKKIDNAKDGDAAFKAMISWIENSVAKLSAKAKRADELESEIATALSAVRENDIRDMLKDSGLPEDQVKAYVTAGLGHNDETYGEWFNSIKLLAMRIKPASSDAVKAEAAKTEETAPVSEEKVEVKPFADFVTSYAEEQNSRVKPAQLRNPKDRLVKGSEVLENAKPVATPDLAKTEGGSSIDSQNPMRTLANELYPVGNKNSK